MKYTHKDKVECPLTGGQNFSLAAWGGPLSKKAHPQGVELVAGGCLPPTANTVGLGNTNGQNQGQPEDGALRLHLLEVVDCRACKCKGAQPEVLLLRKSLTSVGCDNKKMARSCKQALCRATNCTLACSLHFQGPGHVCTKKLCQQWHIQLEIVCC